jgi:predicted AAA+ superfamily ATPase
LDLYTAVGQKARDDALVYLNTFVGAFEAYLTIGGFPQAVAGFRLTGSVPDGFARDLWDVVQSDLRAAGMTRPEQALRLLERVNASLTSRIGFRDVGQSLGVAHSTVGDWLGALADSYLVLHLYQEAGGKPAIDRQRKIYPTDPFLAQLPARLSESASIPYVSQIAEAALCITMFRSVQGQALDRLDASSRLFYYRTQSGGEVDFLVPPAQHVGESKYTDHPSERDTRAMTANFDNGLLLTRSAAGDLPKVIIYPASLFAWLLDQGD